MMMTEQLQAATTTRRGRSRNYGYLEDHLRWILQEEGVENTTCCVPVGLIDCGIAIIDGIVVDRDSEGDIMMSLFLVYIIHMRLIIIHKNTIESKYVCRSHTEYVKWITHNACAQVLVLLPCKLCICTLLSLDRPVMQLCVCIQWCACS